MLQDSVFAPLESFALAGRHRSAAQSRGLCFHASIELAREARRLGLEGRAAFVRWRVRRDLDFLEHWALALESGLVLDMTAAQVDGDSRPLRRIDEYPANYDAPRHYPVAVVLDAVSERTPTPNAHYSRSLLWTMHLGLFRHDARAAAIARSPRALVDAVAAIAHCAFTLAAGGLLERTLARARVLATRLG